MSSSMQEFLSIDAPVLLAGALAAMTCGLLGNFLILRRESLVGDAISHAVLPGLVIGFVLAGTRSTWPMFLGAAASGLVTVGLVSLVRRHGRVEPGAALGVVFSAMFALGVLLIEREARHVDLDASCVLHGQLESVFWPEAPATLGEALRPSALATLPRQIPTLAGMFLVSLVAVLALLKELRIASFDPELARSQGIPVGAILGFFMALVAGAVVASFEAVGSILVIAMLICPGATARLLTDRLGVQIALSVVVALLTTMAGALAAVEVPPLLGHPHAVQTAGAITIAAGVGVALAAVFSPLDGLAMRRRRRRRLGARMAREDLLATLYRAREAGHATVDRATLDAHLARPLAGALRHAARRGWVDRATDGWRLTETGVREGAAVVRRHRLWERYLVDEAGARADHVHDPAELLEHLFDDPPSLPGDATLDPHGRAIPRDDDGA